MLLLWTPHNLRNQETKFGKSHHPRLLQTAELDGTLTQHFNPNSISINIMIAAAPATQTAQHPLFMDSKDEATMMETSPPVSPTSTTNIDVFSSGLGAIHPQMIPIINSPPTHHDKCFSWEDFPLLTENIVYVDSAWQQRKAAIRQLERQPSSKLHQDTDDENDVSSLNIMKTTLYKNPATKLPLRKSHKTRAKSCSRKRGSRNVHFDAVHVREHTVTLGDHEWCDGALAVTLDWPHTSEPKSMLIHDYESMRERQGRVPRGRLPKLEHWQRKQLLQRVGGLSEDEINAHVQQHLQDEHAYAGLSRTKTVPNLVVGVEELQHCVYSKENTI
jgi:hypothetical protein